MKINLVVMVVYLPLLEATLCSSVILPGRLISTIESTYMQLALYDFVGS